MALLWIAGICFLLFNGSVGLPARKGYGYPYKSDSRNMGDDVEDEAIMSYDWQGSHGQPSSAAYISYDSPSAAWQPISVATQQTEPSAPAVESFVKSESRDWILKNPNSPLLFPLSPNYQPSNPAEPQPGPNYQPSYPAEPQPGPNYQPSYPAEPQPGPNYQPSYPAEPQPGPNYQPSYPAEPQPGPNYQPSYPAEPQPGPNYQPSYPAEPQPGPNYQPSYPAEPQPGPNYQPSYPAEPQPGPNYQPSYPAEPQPGPNYQPSYPAEPQQGPNYQPSYPAEPQPGPNYQPSYPAEPQPGPNTGSQNVPGLVYEEVFQYPSENAEQSPSDVSNTAGGPGQAGYLSTGSSTEYSSEPSYQRYPSNAGAKQVASSEEEVSVSRHNRHPPSPPQPIYIIQSRDGYNRVRIVSSKSRYTPGFPSPQAVRSEPARRQAAAPVVVKNPQRSRIYG